MIRVRVRGRVRVKTVAESPSERRRHVAQRRSSPGGRRRPLVMPTTRARAR